MPQIASISRNKGSEYRAKDFIVGAGREKFQKDLTQALANTLAQKKLIIHNAPFDVAFLDNELSKLDPAPGRVLDFASVTDSLALARHKHPGQKNNLDALCRRYFVDNSQRERHGALLDAEILADVYLAMTGGQTVMFSGDQESASATNTTWEIERLPADRPPLLVVEPNPAERVAHAAMQDLLDDTCSEGSVWRRIANNQNAS